MRATTRRLDHDVDLLAVAGDDGYLAARDGVGLAGRGVALRVAMEGDEGAQAALAAIHADDDVRQPGTGPVAFGAWPFRPGAARELVVPQVVVGRDDRGGRWLTTIDDADPGPALAVAPPLHDGPAQVEVRAAEAAADWCKAVVDGREAVRDGHLRKVVLARQLLVEADVAWSPATVLRRLAATFPGCTLGLVDGFVCASPELLVSREGDLVRSHPLAGTAPRGGEPSADARLAAGLIASAKDRAEHQVTIDFVHDALLPWCSFLDEEAEPSIVGVANVQHLGTMVEGRLSDPPPSVLALVDALHPTPAVAGDPREDALELIGRLETGDRGRYAGPVGWVDAAGNGRWAVGIRSAEIDGRHARLWAGVGIVAHSEPDAELEETRAKFQAMLSALTRV